MRNKRKIIANLMVACYTQQTGLPDKYLYKIVLYSIYGAVLDRGVQTDRTCGSVFEAPNKNTHLAMCCWLACYSYSSSLTRHLVNIERMSVFRSCQFHIKMRNIIMTFPTYASLSLNVNRIIKYEMRIPRSVLLFECNDHFLFSHDCCIFARVHLMDGRSCDGAINNPILHAKDCWIMRMYCRESERSSRFCCDAQ